MSFETIQQSIASGEFLQHAEIARKKETPRSLVHILADDMVRVGVDGIVSFTNSRIDRTKKTLELDAQYHNDLREVCRDDLGMLFLGTSVLAIEDSIVEGYFSLRAHLDMVNERIRVLPFSYSITEDQLRSLDKEINPDMRRNMARLAEADPTFASFFDPQHITTMIPYGLKGFLSGVKGVEPILGIMPRYKQFTSPVIRPNTPNADDAEAMKQFLANKDRLIASL